MATIGSSAWRRDVWGAPCDREQLTTDYWIAGGGKIQCHALALSAFRALGRVFRLHRYHVRDNVTGCYNCRTITGGTSASAHAYGLALDVNWDTNPYRLDRVVTDLPRSLIADVQQIHTIAGDRVFRWGGDWDGRPETPHSNYDAMHFEIIATPTQLASGFDVPIPVVSDPSTWPLLGIHERGDAVRVLQSILAIDQDGLFGPLTRAAVIEFQRVRGLPVDGVVGLGTWTALLTLQPALRASEIAPDKGQTIVPRASARIAPR